MPFRRKEQGTRVKDRSKYWAEWMPFFARPKPSVLRHSLVFLCFEITWKRLLRKLDWMPSVKLRSGKGGGGGGAGLIPRVFPLLFHESPASRTSVFAILNIVFSPNTAFVSKFWRIPLLRSSQIPHPVKISQIPHYTNPASQDHPSRSCKTFSATADLHHVVWLNSLCVYILCF